MLTHFVCPENFYKYPVPRRAACLYVYDQSWQICGFMNVTRQHFWESKREWSPKKFAKKSSAHHDSVNILRIRPGFTWNIRISVPKISDRVSDLITSWGCQKSYFGTRKKWNLGRGRDGQFFGEKAPKLSVCINSGYKVQWTYTKDRVCYIKPQITI